MVRLLAFLGLLALAVLAWAIMAGSTLAGLLVAPRIQGEAGRVMTLVAAVAVAGGFLLYYLVLVWCLLHAWWIAGLRECFRELFVRSLCLLWFPLGSTVLPLAARSLGTDGVRLQACVVGGFFVGWALAALTLHARSAPTDVNA